MNPHPIIIKLGRRKREMAVLDVHICSRSTHVLISITGNTTEALPNLSYH